MSREPLLREPPLVDGSLPRQLTGLRSPIIWGVLLLIAIEGTLLALFVVSRVYLGLGADAWPPATVTPPGLLGPSLAQALLLASAVPVALAARALPRGGTRTLVLGLPVGIALVAGYLVITTAGLVGREDLWHAHAYASMDWTMTGYAAFHAVAVALAGATVWGFALRGHFHRGRYTGVQALALYWAFVALGSLLFYATQHLAPLL